MVQSKLGPSWWGQLQPLLNNAAPAVKTGFEQYRDAWQENQSTRAPR
jgi:hypothetical protein